MNFNLVSPRLTFQKGDFLGSGIPYWPVELATFASFLKDKNHIVTVFDLFGADPRRLEAKSNFFLQGIPVLEAVTTPLPDDAVFVIFAISFMSHLECVEICEKLRKKFPTTTIAILENSQAVTAYAIPFKASSFFAAGADVLICGEPYWNWIEIENVLRDRKNPMPENLMANATTAVKRITSAQTSLPIPAWDLFPVENYWRLPYSHGPKTKKFFPIITSRGCPYPCDFCVVPETNQRKWRPRSAKEVFEEICFLQARFGVDHFQIEDLNPTINAKRMQQLADLIVENNVKVGLYIVSGTKAETVPIQIVPALAKAGLRYISISPETGSERLRKEIGKPFDHEHGLRLVAKCAEYKIRTQACFITGHPGETEEDHSLSLAYLQKLLRVGLDEVAVFIVSPFAGSKLYRENRLTSEGSTQYFSFTPTQRTNFKKLSQRRSELIRSFFLYKIFRPQIWAQGLRSLFGVPQTKMENLPKRVIFILFLLLNFRIKKVREVAE